MAADRSLCMSFQVAECRHDGMHPRAYIEALSGALMIDHFFWDAHDATLSSIIATYTSYPTLDRNWPSTAWSAMQILPHFQIESTFCGLQEAASIAAAAGVPIWFEPVSVPKSTRAVHILGTRDLHLSQQQRAGEHGEWVAYSARPAWAPSPCHSLSIGQHGHSRV